MSDSYKKLKYFFWILVMIHNNSNKTQISLNKSKSIFQLQINFPTPNQFSKMPSQKTQASKATKKIVEDFLRSLSPVHLAVLPATGNYSVFKPMFFKVGSVYHLKSGDYSCKFTIKWVYNFTRHVLMEFPDGSKKEFKRLGNAALDNNQDIITHICVDEEILEEHREELRRRAAAREAKKAAKKKQNAEIKISQILEGLDEAAAAAVRAHFAC